MNERHTFCGSDGWRALVRERIVPWALADRDLGVDVLEVGPGYGATTDVFREQADQLTAVEIDRDLAHALAARFDGTNVTVVEGDATALTFDERRFTGATCFNMLHHVPSTDLQDRIFAEVARVLRPGAWFVATDSVYSPDTAEGHEGDTYLPVDPATLPARLAGSGFVDIDLEIDDDRFGWGAWAARARRAPNHEGAPT